MSHPTTPETRLTADHWRRIRHFIRPCVPSYERTREGFRHLLAALTPYLEAREQAAYQRGQDDEAAEWLAVGDAKREQAIREDERRKVLEQMQDTVKMSRIAGGRAYDQD